MRRILPFVTALAVYLMTPLAGEITESLVHLLATGHTAHAIDDEGHEPDGPEHCCTGPFHLCLCHSSIAFTAAAAAIGVGSPVPREIEGGWWHEDAPPEGYLARVFRPPIA